MSSLKICLKTELGYRFILTKWRHIEIGKGCCSGRRVQDIAYGHKCRTLFWWGNGVTRYGSHWSSKATMSQQCHAVARKTTYPSTHEGWSPDNIWRNPSTLISTGYTSFGLLHIIFEYQISRKVSPSWREARGQLRHHHNPTIFF